MPIRILIVEDHQPTQELIREHLARDSKLNVVAETTDGAEAVTLAEQHRPDIVLMDIALKGMDGLKATKLIKKSCPTTEVIILTNYPLDDWKERARESPQMMQSSAFLNKQEIGKSLLPIINSLMAGKLGESDS